MFSGIIENIFSLIRLLLCFYLVCRSLFPVLKFVVLNLLLLYYIEKGLAVCVCLWSFIISFRILTILRALLVCSGVWYKVWLYFGVSQIVVLSLILNFVIYDSIFVSNRFSQLWLFWNFPFSLSVGLSAYSCIPITVLKTSISCFKAELGGLGHSRPHNCIWPQERFLHLTLLAGSRFSSPVLTTHTLPLCPCGYL